MPDFEIIIIGAGVVGLAIGARLSKKHPSLLIVEKNEKYGMETSSRNSEVIHAGIYYTSGSLKALLCVEGKEELYSLCDRYSLPHRKITKLITAVDDTEAEKLNGIFQNGKLNGVPLRMLDRESVKTLEPNIRSCIALFSPSTGIISSHDLMDFFASRMSDRGGILQHRCSVVGIGRDEGDYALTVEEGGRRSTVTSEIVINAAGLSSDRIAEQAGIDIDEAGYRLVYCKGSYFSVTPSKSNLVSRLVYPVPRNEGLGVHALIDWGGRLKFGPDTEFLPDRTLDYSVHSSKRHTFAESIRHILPMIDDDDIEPDMSGIRPKLQKPGEPPKDFIIRHEKDRGLEGFVNLIGIDSPGLTASPAIARYVDTLLFS